MKKSLSTIAIVCVMSMNAQTTTFIQYPETKKGEVKDVYFGTEVNDPYRWLEDDRSK